MKALKEKRNSFRSLWRMGLVILSVFALAFAACSETGTTGGGSGTGADPTIEASAGPRTNDTEATVVLLANKDGDVFYTTAAPADGDAVKASGLSLGAITGGVLTPKPVTLAAGAQTVYVVLVDDDDKVSEVATASFAAQPTAPTTPVEAHVTSIIFPTLDPLVIPGITSTVKTSPRYTGELENTENYSFEGQPPNLNYLAGKGTMYWSDGRITPFSLSGIKTTPNVLSQDYISDGPLATTTTGDVTIAAPVIIQMYHSSNPGKTYPVQLPGVVALDKTKGGVGPNSGGGAAINGGGLDASLQPLAAGGKGGVLWSGSITQFYQDDVNLNLTGINVTGYYQKLGTSSGDLSIFNPDIDFDGPTRPITLSNDYIFEDWYYGFPAVPVPSRTTAMNRWHPLGVEVLNISDQFVNILISKGETFNTGPSAANTHGGGSTSRSVFIRVPIDNYFWIRDVQVASAEEAATVNATKPVVWKGGPQAPNDFWWPDEAYRGLQANAPSGDFGYMVGTTGQTRRQYWEGVLNSSDLALKVYYEGEDHEKAIQIRPKEYYKWAYAFQWAELVQPPDLAAFLDDGTAPLIRANYYPSYKTALNNDGYANEIAGLEVPLAVWDDVKFERNEKTAIQQGTGPEDMDVFLKIYAVPNNLANRTKLLSMVQETYDLWGEYTHPDPTYTANPLKRTIPGGFTTYASWFDFTDVLSQFEEEIITPFAVITTNQGTDKLPRNSYYEEYWDDKEFQFPVRVTLRRPGVDFL